MRMFPKALLVLFFIGLCGCQTLANIPTPMSQSSISSSDQSITAAIKSAFFDSGNYADATIDVVTEGNVVTLTGFVKTIRQYDTAVQIASETTGVKGVRNHLVIRK